ncbi:MAG: hypothetical protein KatS3mg076_2871 [Candidatus Binatia bacterium]|nr:MAG: hypothetical protein KatS3mg076_2871 [Candidatus Binatia bacterium]
MRPGRERRGSHGLVLFWVALFLVAVSAACHAGEPVAEKERLLARLRSHPTDPQVFADLATWLLRRGEVARALEAAQEAVRLAPDAPQFRRLVGILAALRGDEARAVAALERAAGADPEARVLLGDFRLAQAWFEYRKAIWAADPRRDLEDRLRALAAVREIAPEADRFIELGAELGDGQEMVGWLPPVYLGPAGDRVVVVEKSAQTLRLYRKVGDRLVLEEVFPCSTGRGVGAKKLEGDGKTPDGVYLITDFLPGNRLAEFYGDFALPLNYPNAWDRREGRTGHGIWIHGTDRLAQASWARETRGCIVLRNSDLLELAERLEPGGTPVVVAERVGFVPADRWEGRASRFLSDSARSLVAVVEFPGFTATMERTDDGTVVTYAPADGGEILREVVRAIPPLRWSALFRELRGRARAELLGARVGREDDVAFVEIETSWPVRLRGLHSGYARRAYFEIEGLPSGGSPLVLPGDGRPIEEVAILPSGRKWPRTRIVVSLGESARHRTEREGRVWRIRFEPDVAAGVAAKSGGERDG